MNAFEIRPEPEAEDQLAAIWTAAVGHRDEITVAQNTADQRLASDPLRYGRHIGEGLYRLDVPPLVVYYSVLSAERVVIISGIHFRP